MKLTSSAFAEGHPIAPRYTGIGEDVSPSLAWSEVPENAKSFAIICDDPDAPSRANPRPEGPWVHWVIYNLPADLRELPEAVARQAELSAPVVAQQGTNSFDDDNVGYRGPLPPSGSGPHRYRFHLYAVDQRLDIEPAEATKASLLAALDGHVLGQAVLMGTFEQKEKG